MIFSVVAQEYRVTVPEESAIKGNSAFFQCNIPSFGSEFLDVVGWISSEGTQFRTSANFGNNKYLELSQFKYLLLYIFSCVSEI